MSEYPEQRARKAEQEADAMVEYAYQVTPEPYNRFIMVLSRNQNFAGKNQKPVYGTIHSPYMKVDGQVLMARHHHQAQNAHMDVYTEYYQVGDVYTCRVTVTSGIHGTVQAHSIVNFGGSGADSTNPLETAECVPLSTQILTRDGFKFYYQISLGEEVASYSTERKRIEWVPLLAVRTFQDSPLVQLKNKYFKAVCTPDHKWLIENQRGEQTLIPQNEIPYENGAYRFVFCGAEGSDIEAGDDGRMLGWLFTDCQRNYTESGMISTCYISQAKEENFDVLTKLFGVGSRREKYKETWLTPYEWIVGANRVREICSLFHVNTTADLPKAVARMSIEDCKGFYLSAIAADGDKKAFGKSDYHTVEAVQIACLRLGIKTGPITQKWFHKSTKPFYSLGIHKTRGAYVNTVKVTTLPPGDVWCPTTRNGTWIARQNGQVFVTGNTSAYGRALRFMGYGVFGSDPDNAYDPTERQPIGVRDIPNMSGTPTPEPKQVSEPISDKQLGRLRGLLNQCGVIEGNKTKLISAVYPQGITKREASDAISLIKDGGKLIGSWANVYTGMLTEQHSHQREEVAAWMKDNFGTNKPATLTSEQQKQLFAWIAGDIDDIPESEPQPQEEVPEPTQSDWVSLARELCESAGVTHPELTAWAVNEYAPESGATDLTELGNDVYAKLRSINTVAIKSGVENMKQNAEVSND